MQYILSKEEYEGLTSLRGKADLYDEIANQISKIVPPDDCGEEYCDNCPLRRTTEVEISPLSFLSSHCLVGEIKNFSK